MWKQKNMGTCDFVINSLVVSFNFELLKQWFPFVFCFCFTLFSFLLVLRPLDIDFLYSVIFFIVTIGFALFPVYLILLAISNYHLHWNLVESLQITGVWSLLLRQGMFFVPRVEMQPFLSRSDFICVVVYYKVFLFSCQAVKSHGVVSLNNSQVIVIFLSAQDSHCFSLPCFLLYL